jgi:hypothetical protein
LKLIQLILINDDLEIGHWLQGSDATSCLIKIRKLNE